MNASLSDGVPTVLSAVQKVEAAPRSVMIAVTSSATGPGQPRQLEAGAGVQPEPRRRLRGDRHPTAPAGAPAVAYVPVTSRALAVSGSR